MRVITRKWNTLRAKKLLFELPSTALDLDVGKEISGSLPFKLSRSAV